MVNKYLFNGGIDGWDSWGKIFQSIDAWETLVNFILEKENLPISKIENLHPGTNAVFKSGNYVVKIFAPKESGLDGSIDYKTEKFALNFAQSHGVAVSKLFVYGDVNDKYYFPYMILEYIEGTELYKVSGKFNESEKFEFGKRLREITDLMNKPCEDFNGIDVIFNKSRYNRWDEYSDKFRRERLEYLKNRDFGEKVFVHGDLCDDNIMIDDKNNIYIIDFADSVKAPVCYEHAHLICGLFNFDKSYLHGYFGEYKTDGLADICFDGMLLHDFGGDMITWGNTAKIEEIDCLDDLREKVKEKIKL